MTQGDILQLDTPRVFVPLLTPSRYKAAWGGRGSGKSYFFADAALERCYMNTTRIVCIREVQKSLDLSVRQLLVDRIKHYGLEDEFRILRSHIETPGDGIISFQGMQDSTATAIRSLEGYDIAWVEEAQDLSQDSLDTLRPTIRKPNSELWFSWNPRLEKDAVDVFFRGAEGAKVEHPYYKGTAPKDSTIVRANWSDNPWFADTALQEEMEYDRRRDPEKYKHIWLGEYRKYSDSRVFSNWCIEEFDTPEDARFFFGADWGFGDPSVLVRMWVHGRNLYIDDEAYRINCPLDELPALFDKVPGSRKWPIRADSSRPETIDFMKKRGFTKMSSSVKGKGSVEDGVEFLKSFDIRIHPRCRHTADEFALYSYKVNNRVNPPEVLPVIEDKQNHCIDAARYALEGERLAPKRIVVTPEVKLKAAKPGAYALRRPNMSRRRNFIAGRVVQRRVV